MSKLEFLLLAGLVVSMAACGGQATVRPTVAPTATKAPPPTVAKATSPAPAASAYVPKLDPGGMCKATSAPKPVPSFPTTLPADQSQGSDNAPMTLYEYSDFQ